MLSAYPTTLFISNYLKAVTTGGCQNGYFLEVSEIL